MGDNTSRRRVEGLKGPVRKIVEDWVPPLASVEIFEFDRQGNQVFDPVAACVIQPPVIRTHPDGGRTEVQTISGFDFWSMPALNGAAFPARGADLAETTFTAADLPAHTVFRSKDGTETARIRYEHDGKRRVSEAVRHTLVPPALPPLMAEWARTATPSELGALAYEIDPKVVLRVTFQYDDAGRVLEQSQFYDSHLAERIGYTYNERGDILAVTRSGRGHEGTYIFQYDYEYDTRGNWVRQVVRFPSGDVGECRREITYYE